MVHNEKGLLTRASPEPLVKENMAIPMLPTTMTIYTGLYTLVIFISVSHLRLLNCLLCSFIELLGLGYGVFGLDLGLDLYLRAGSILINIKYYSMIN